MNFRLAFLVAVLVISVNSVTAFRDGTRIMWDYSTLSRVSQGTYPRFERLQNGQIMCVAEDNSGIFCSFSSSGGARWTSQIRIKNDESNIHMAVPEVIQLSNGIILVAYNGRVKTENGLSRFDIRVISSSDNGINWINERIIYQAGTNFGTGCWEPAFLDKGTGEIQVYFANEAPFSNSNDQEIAVVKSFDNGNNWSSANRVSYRLGSRDGMPVPVKLNNNNGFVVAIEDYYNNSFIPSLIYSADANWTNYIDGYSSNRWFASSDSWLTSTYNGAPYIAKHTNGETILSFMTTYNRTSDEKLADMVVGIGNSEARNFKNYSRPFNIPNDKYGLWNSLFVKNDTTITAISSTNAFPYSGENTSWVMSKDGYWLNDLDCSYKTPALDGIIDATEYGKQIVYIGAYTENNIKIRTAFDNTNLYIAVVAKDKKLWQDSDHPLNDDAIRVLLDPQNKNAIRTGVFSFSIDLLGNIKFQEGNASGYWSTKTVSGVSVAKKINGTINNNADVDDGYVLEIAIPWSVLSISPANTSGFGINFCMYNDNDGSGNDYIENISGNEELLPATWCKIVPDFSNSINPVAQNSNNEIIVADNHVKVASKDKSLFNLKVFDSIGKLVFAQSKVTSAELDILKKGCYFFQIQKGTYLYAEKIIL